MKLSKKIIVSVFVLMSVQSAQADVAEIFCKRVLPSGVLAGAAAAIANYTMTDSQASTKLALATLTGIGTYIFSYCCSKLVAPTMNEHLLKTKKLLERAPAWYTAMPAMPLIEMYDYVKELDICPCLQKQNPPLHDIDFALQQLTHYCADLDAACNHASSASHSWFAPAGFKNGCLDLIKKMDAVKIQVNACINALKAGKYMHQLHQLPGWYTSMPNNVQAVDICAYVKERFNGHSFGIAAAVRELRWHYAILQRLAQELQNADKSQELLVVMQLLMAELNQCINLLKADESYDALEKKMAQCNAYNAYLERERAQEKAKRDAVKREQAKTNSLSPFNRVGLPKPPKMGGLQRPKARTL